MKQCQAYSAPASLCGDVRWQGSEMGSAPLGAIAERVLLGDVPLRYYLYTPRECAPRGLVVCVHGISRNACEHVTILWPFAERWGLALAAPLFTDPPFHGYQRLGWAAGSARADLALTQMVEVVARLVEVPNDDILLFGYSGGAQFVHRYTMAYPERVRACATTAAGWYTLPDPAAVYPYGLQLRTGSVGTHFDPRRFLCVPMLVLVGGHDTGRGVSLRTSPRLNQEQGSTRIERAVRFVNAMRASACALALEPAVKLEVLTGADHSFRRCTEQHGLGEKVFTFFSDVLEGRKEMDPLSVRIGFNEPE